MSEIEKGAAPRSKFWIWFLVFILVVLLMVPVLSIGLALKKTGWTAVSSSHRELQKTDTGSTESAPYHNEAMSALREQIEKVAARVIKTPTLHSKMQQVQIQSSAPSMSKAAESVHAVLKQKNHQFVEAISPDSLRIVVILPGCEWAELSGSLQTAAEKDGFTYRGPSQTTSAESGADTMVAEIEILRKVTIPAQAKAIKK